jgi:hypothetical protein
MVANRGANRESSGNGLSPRPRQAPGRTVAQFDTARHSGSRGDRRRGAAPTWSPSSAAKATNRSGCLEKAICTSSRHRDHKPAALSPIRPGPTTAVRTARFNAGTSPVGRERLVRRGINLCRLATRSRACPATFPVAGHRPVRQLDLTRPRVDRSSLGSRRTGAGTDDPAGAGLSDGVCGASPQKSKDQFCGASMTPSRVTYICSAILRMAVLLVHGRRPRAGSRWRRWVLPTVAMRAAPFNAGLARPVQHRSRLTATR